MMKKKLNINDDWRNQGQEKYLLGIKLYAQTYRPYGKNWDHDHCEFCGDKFSLDERDLHFGYSSEDGYHWICENCFDDFKEKFKWVICDSNTKDNE